MDEPPSRLLKSRIPRKTVISHAPLTNGKDFRIYDAHCPLRKGIICYHRDNTILEHHIHSSGKHEPRIIVPKHPSRRLEEISFVPIKGNRILLFARYSGARLWRASEDLLHLSIHEIRSDHRIGAALWSFNSSVSDHLNVRHLKLIKSAENELGLTFWAQFDDHFKLFDISTTETNTSDNLLLIESGRIDCDLKFKLKSSLRDGSHVLSPDTHILLNVDTKDKRRNETIDIHYLDSGGTKFSIITRLSIPVAEAPSRQESHFAFSADGSKFAMAMAHGGVSVWDIRSKVPLQTFTDPHQPKVMRRLLQFSSGNLGKEILAFVEYISPFAIIRVIDTTSLETEERLFLKSEDHALVKLFFDPHEGIMYAELDGTIYEWDLRKKEPGPEWWIGEE